MNEIRMLRNQANLSQRELALASGLAEKTLSFIENDKVQPTLSHWYKLKRICQYGVRSEEFKEYRFVGDRLYSLRAEAQLSQKELEEKLLLPATNVSAWETEKRIPPVKALKKLCVFFGVKPDYFFEEISSKG